MRADDEMSEQERETSRSHIAHPSASESAPPDVHVDRVKPETHKRQCPLVVTRSDRDEEPEKRTRSDDDYEAVLLSVNPHDV